MPEIRRHRRNVPVILCGCQSDLRNDPEICASLGKRGRAPVTSEQALAVCCDVGASNYVETSSLMSEVSEAFEVAAIAFMKTMHRYNTSSSHHSEKKFNTNSSKASSHKLNVSSDTATEFSLGQLAQPQPPLATTARAELEDFFDVTTSPVVPRQRPLLASQRASFSVSSPAQHPKVALMRKTSFRSPVVVQKAPNAGTTGPTAADKAKAKAYESLKSQGSTGSTGSKTSTTSTSSVIHLDMDEAPHEDHEAQDVFNQLSFVSPKAGVYRPLNTAAAPSAKVKDKDKCLLM